MALNANDRTKVEKLAESNGYSWNSQGNKMINGNGGSVAFSATGQSVNVNGSSYNTTAGANNSKKW